MSLENKKILFLSVKTFGLEEKIKNKLKSLGAEVDLYDERPSNSIFVKGLIRLKRNIYENRITNYYKKLLELTKDKEYDFLFVNKGEVVPSFFLERFSVSHPNTYKIFYTWDSLKNNPNQSLILGFFDDKYTFDSEDATELDIKLRPLFFLDTFRKIPKFEKQNSEYDLLFLGTAHSDRYILTNKIIDWCNKNNLTSYSFFYLQSRLVYFFKKFFDPTFKHFDYKRLSFKSLSTDEIYELYKKSNVILDINHPNQNGLTMRTFEAIGANRKLITTNQKVKNYSFYNPDNILVIDRDDFNIDKSFFIKPYQELPKVMYENLSLEGWLKEIFKMTDSKNWIEN